MQQGRRERWQAPQRASLANGSASRPSMAGAQPLRRQSRGMPTRSAPPAAQRAIGDRAAGQGEQRPWPQPPALQAQTTPLFTHTNATGVGGGGGRAEGGLLVAPPPCVFSPCSPNTHAHTHTHTCTFCSTRGTM